MARELRICNPYDADGVLKYEKGRYTGLLSEYANSMVELFGRGTNATVILRSQNDGVGELIPGNNGAFDGCLGLLQNNQSDFMLREVSFPINIDNVTQGYVVYESKEQFMSLYNTTRLETAQNLSSFAYFDRDVWLLCFLTLVLGSVVLKLTSHLDKRSKKNLSLLGRVELNDKRCNMWHVFVHMIASGSLVDNSGLPRKTLFFSLSIFAILVLFYFRSIIKTEIVVTVEPFVLRTYSDLLQRRVGLSFLNTSDAYLWFKLAKNGTLQQQVWQMSQEQLKDKILVKPDPVFMGQTARLMYYGATAWVVPSTNMQMMANEFCDALCSDKSVEYFSPVLDIPFLKVDMTFPYIAEDASARTFQMSMVFNAADTPLMRAMRTTMRVMSEKAWPSRMTYAVEHLRLVPTIVGSRGASKWSEKYHKCVDNTIVKPDVHLQAISIDSMKHSIILFISLDCAYVIVLLVEKLIHRPRVRVTQQFNRGNRFAKSKPRALFMTRQRPCTAHPLMVVPNTIAVPSRRKLRHNAAVAL